MTRSMGPPKLAVGLSLALVLFLLATGELAAHADLLGADPAPNSIAPTGPEQVRLFFSEPVQPQFLALEVYGPDGRRVDRGDGRVSPNDVRVVAVSLPRLSDGVYTVKWRVLSLDDHVVRGTFVFGVGAGTTLDPGAQTRPATFDGSFVVNAAIRWLTYAAAFLLLGGFGFRALIRSAPTGRAADSVVGVAMQRRWLWVSWGAVTVLILAAFAALLVQAAALGGVSLTRVFEGQELAKLLTSRYGYLWAGRVVQLLAVVAVLAVMSVTPSSRGYLWLGAALGAGVLGTISATGHTNSVQGPTWLLIAMDWLHLAAGGLWVGGLVHLLLVLPVFMRAERTRAALLQGILPRFSWYAGLSVAVLIFTGAFQAVLYMGSWSALSDTLYGVVLSSKALLIAPLLLIAALNLVVMSPRLRSRARGGQASCARRAFRYLLAGELVLALVVLVASAVLAGLPPASTLPPTSAPFTATAHTFSYAIELGIMPNQVGENTVDARVTDHLGVPSEVEAARLRLAALELEAGVRDVPLEQLAVGRFAAPKAALNAPGRWQAVITMRQGGREEEARFEFTVGRAPALPTFSPARIGAGLLTIENARTAATAAIVALGLVVVVQTARAYGLRSSDGLIRIGVVLLALAMGLLFVFGRGDSRTNQNVAFAANPFPATRESLAIGEGVYRAECQSCHGVAGRGDGPDGLLLRPQPADLRVHMAAGHTDAQLFSWLSNGVEGTAMPAYRERLSVEERWLVLNFIRTFALPER